MVEFEIGTVLVQLFVLYLLARISAIVVARFGIPGLVGEILAGILVANLIIGDWSFISFLGLQNAEYEHVIKVFAELGVIFLLFSVGLETKFKDIAAVSRPAFYVAIIGVIIPLILGFTLIMALPNHGNHMEALFIGAAMVATSVGITAKVIQDMRLFHTIEAKIIIAAAVIDDVIGMIILGIVVGIANAEAAGGAVDLINIVGIAAVAILFVLAMIFIGVKGIPKAQKIHAQRHSCDVDESRRTKINPLVIALIVCLGLSALADSIGLAAIIGAFLAGMLFTQFTDVCTDLEHKFIPINEFLVPFFFINVGLLVDLESFANLDLLLISGGIIFLAVISKFVAGHIGVRLGARYLDLKSGSIVGIGMVPRGEVGIIIAAIGLSAGAIGSDMYTVVVLMSLATTLIAPAWLASAYRKKYKDKAIETPRPPGPTV